MEILILALMIMLVRCQIVPSLALNLVTVVALPGARIVVKGKAELKKLKKVHLIYNCSLIQYIH